MFSAKILHPLRRYGKLTSGSVTTIFGLATIAPIPHATSFYRDGVAFRFLPSQPLFP